MRKYLFLLLSIVFLIGCEVHKIYDDGINNVINTVLYKNISITNVNYEGYSLYLPQGTSLVDKNDTNLKIKDHNYYYYLYVDTIAYHYKTVNEIKLDNSHFFISKLSNNNYFGYLDIEEVEDKYFIVIMYNYAKIEGYVDKKDFYESFTNICSILSSVKYNDAIISAFIDEAKEISVEEKFDIFSSKREIDNFLVYEEEYQYYNKDNIKGKDDDTIDLQEID